MVEDRGLELADTIEYNFVTLRQVGRVVATHETTKKAFMDYVEAVRGAVEESIVLLDEYTRELESMTSERPTNVQNGTLTDPTLKGQMNILCLMIKKSDLDEELRDICTAVLTYISTLITKENYTKELARRLIH